MTIVNRHRFRDEKNVNDEDYLLPLQNQAIVNPTRKGAMMAADHGPRTALNIMAFLLIDGRFGRVGYIVGMILGASSRMFRR